tara:strand:+ start:11214 stop:12167 length:954 start_codon:yes stop_codon:yes gene_type:complete
MKTEVRKSNANVIANAAKLLKDGKLVAFPTETVYGLGANAFDAKAVKQIFKVKGRPVDNPLIVHVGSKADINLVAKNIPSVAKKLIQEFWPGPLTLVLEKRKSIPSIVSANLQTVAIRMPSNKIALFLICKAKVPLAAPSANSAGKPSPTSATHVLQDLKNKIPLIVDGGSTHIGLESTVLDLTTSTPTLLRPGKITLPQLEKVLGVINLPSSKNTLTKSPGMKYKHYAPKAKVIVLHGSKKKVLKEIQLTKKKFKSVVILDATKNQSKVANQLFAFFRNCDKKGIKNILVIGSSHQGLGHALMNRIEKAASKIIRV